MRRTRAFAKSCTGCNREPAAADTFRYATPRCHAALATLVFTCRMRSPCSVCESAAGPLGGVPHIECIAVAMTKEQPHSR